MNYELFPIPSSDINYPIYYMVRSFFSQSHYLNLPPSEFEKEWEGVEIEKGSNFCFFLTFPSEDYSISYDRLTLQREIIILKDCTIIHKDDVDVPFEAYLFGDEEKYLKTTYEPHLEHYYVDFDPISKKNCIVKVRDAFELKNYPEFFNNTIYLRNALDKMFYLLKGMEPESGDWTRRIETTIKMVDNKVNELHILHNAGLYDFQILERNLENNCMDESKWRYVFNDYVSQLKVFAMYALNKLGWSMHSSGYGKDPESLEVAEMLETERTRRMAMIE